MSPAQSSRWSKGDLDLQYSSDEMQRCGSDDDFDITVCGNGMSSLKNPISILIEKFAELLQSVYSDRLSYLKLLLEKEQTPTSESQGTEPKNLSTSSAHVRKLDQCLR